MKKVLTLWRVDLKRTMKLLPAMLLTAVLLLAVLSGIVIGLLNTVYKDSPAIQITVAVVDENDNPLTDLVIQYIQGMESISESCRFVMVSNEEGFSMLREGSAAAALVLPYDMVEGILSGDNVPVQVYFPENAGIESALFRELTEAGVGMLRVAQAEIYGIYDTAMTYGAYDKLSVLEADIDRYNLAFALDRLALFQMREVSATGGLNLMQYGMASGMIFFLLLSGMSGYSMMKAYPDGFRKQLMRQGIGITAQVFGKWLCGLCGIGITFGCFLLLVKGILTRTGYGAWLPEINLRGVGVLLAVLLCVTSYVFLLFQLADNAVAAVLLLFLLSTVMHYFAGGFLPSVFLPDRIRQIGNHLPSAYLIEAVGSLYTGNAVSRTIGILLLFTAGFWTAAFCIRRRARI